VIDPVSAFLLIASATIVPAVTVPVVVMFLPSANDKPWLTVISLLLELFPMISVYTPPALKAGAYAVALKLMFPDVAFLLIASQVNVAALTEVAVIAPNVEAPAVREFEPISTGWLNVIDPLVALRLMVSIFIESMLIG